MTRLAYFPQDLIGDALVWANQIKAFATWLIATRRMPCEAVVFCTKSVADLFHCMAFCDRVVSYDPTMPWTAEEARGFGRFDAVVNTRYDADSVARVEALDHDAAYGFENIDIPESICKRVYDGYVPLSRWDDFHLRRETSVTEQGAEIVRLLDKGYHCEFVEFGKSDFVREVPEPADAHRVVFVIGASDPAKSWGLDNYLEVACFVRHQGFLPLFLLGPKERSLTSRIREAGFAVGECLPFRKIAGYFDPNYGTRCVVGNDTGLMHLACALGAPSVTIMPYGTHFTWFPYGKDKRARHICLAPDCASVLCLNECADFTNCAARIAVGEVEKAVLGATAKEK